MFNIRLMAIHSYVECILCFSNILFITCAFLRVLVYICVCADHMAVCVWVYVDLYVRVGVRVCAGTAWTLAFQQLKPMERETVN